MENAAACFVNYTALSLTKLNWKCDVWPWRKTIASSLWAFLFVLTTCGVPACKLLHTGAWMECSNPKAILCHFLYPAFMDLGGTCNPGVNCYVICCAASESKTENDKIQNKKEQLILKIWIYLSNWNGWHWLSDKLIHENNFIQDSMA